MRADRGASSLADTDCCFYYTMGFQSWQAWQKQSGSFTSAPWAQPHPHAAMLLFHIIVATSVQSYSRRGREYLGPVMRRKLTTDPTSATRGHLTSHFCAAQEEAFVQTVYAGTKRTTVQPRVFIK